MTWMHLPQALIMSPAASAPGWMPGWVHWPEAPATFLVAALISWASILYGFHHKGRPFGSATATRHTTIIIFGTALIAAILSVFVPHLPLSIGIFIPALLCRSVLKEEEGEQELRAAHPQLAAIITLGIGYMVGELRAQISLDRADWCNSLIGKLRILDENRVENQRANLESFPAAAIKVKSMLMKILPQDEQTQLEVHYKAVGTAVAAAKTAFDLGNLDTEDGFFDEYVNADVALFKMLVFAYNLKYDSINTAFTGHLEPAKPEPTGRVEPPKPPERV